MRTARAVPGAIAAGAGVMALEILASRWLARSFGFTLSTWAVLISVTLLAGSIGALLGGLLARRTALAGPALLLAAAWTALAGLGSPHLVPALLETRGLLGPVVAGAAILLVPAAALGTLLPLLAEAVRGRENPGRTVGVLVAASTLGSLGGTLLPGLWLIPDAGLRVTAFATAALLAVAGGIVSTGGRTRLLGAAAAAGFTVFAAFPQKAPSGVEIRRESPFGTVEVVRTRTGAAILVNGIVQGAESPLTVGPGSLLSRRQYVELLPYLHPRGRTALCIGLGTGRYARCLETYGIDVLSVDVDPVLVDLARRYLGFSGRVEIADGRAAIARRGPRYSFIVLDVFRGETLPGHLMTVEAFAEMRARLEPGGILCVHLIGTPGAPATAAVARTLSEAFPKVLCLQSGMDEAVADIFLLASDRPLTVPPNPELARFGWIGNEAFRPDLSGAELLTDDRNPLDKLNEPTARRLRLASRGRGWR